MQAQFVSIEPRPFLGEHAQDWISRIGEHGDPIRQQVIKPIICSILEYRSDLENSIPQVPWLSQHSLRRTYMREAKLGRPADEALRLLRGRNLVDVGCGEGYLGRWAAEHGAKYFGCDPSEELIKHAQKYVSSSAYSYGSIENFNHNEIQGNVDLIALIGVLEYCGPVEISLAVLRNQMTALGLERTPLYVATFDPDFFDPAGALSREEINAAGHYMSASVCSVARLERAFVSSGFHVIEQMPTIINYFPDDLFDYTIKEFNRLPTHRSSNPLRLPQPRQGPFYHWLLMPSKTSAISTTSYSVGERIGLHANKIAHISQVVSGSAKMTNDALGVGFKFVSGRRFGQMEIDESHYSARLLGDIVATEETTVSHIPFSTFSSVLSNQNELVSTTFHDLIYYFSAARFDGFITGTRSTGDKDDASSIFKGESVTMLSSVASCLLRKSTAVDRDHQPPYRRPDPMVLFYPSRDLERDIYRNDRRRSKPPYVKALRRLRDCGIIDSFSLRPYNNSFHTLRTLKGDPEQQLANLLRSIPDIGKVSMSVIADIIDLKEEGYDETALADSVDDMKLQLAIHHYLGQDDCSERFNQFAGPSSGTRFLKSQRSGSPELAHAIASTIADAWDIPSRYIGMIADIFSATREVFSFTRNHGAFDREHLSPYFIIRDVWALFGCLSNSENLLVAQASLDIDFPRFKPHVENYLWRCISEISSDVIARDSIKWSS